MNDHDEWRAEITQMTEVERHTTKTEVMRHGGTVDREDYA